MTVGQDQAFEVAFEPLFQRAFLVARRILDDAAESEDAAAEAMARAYAHWHKIGDQPWREGWVVRVATNLALDVARKRRHRADEPVVDTAVIDDDAAVRLALVAALAKLPKRQREVVALRHLAGMSEDQTAAALQVSAGSVKTHLHRGIAALRRVLGDDAGFEEVADVV